jgi:hypothetical protein
LKEKKFRERGEYKFHTHPEERKQEIFAFSKAKTSGSRDVENNTREKQFPSFGTHESRAF